MDKDDRFPRWNHDDPQSSLVSLYEWTVDNALKQIHWYDQKTKPKRLFSQSLLVLAVLFGGIGILCPLIDNACKNCVVPILDCSVSFLHLGYILIAMGGVIILFDRCFGFSVGWMRFVETKLKLEQSLKEFCFDWSIEVSRQVPYEKKGEHQAELLSRLSEFTKKVETLVIGETKAWILEFRKNLSDLDKLVDKGK